MRRAIQAGCLSLLVATLMVAMFAIDVADAQEAEWIWSPAHPKDAVPRTSCHFRKTFTLRDPENGQITIVADDEYELYVNGRRVGVGRSARQLDEFNIQNQLVGGRNTIAVRVVNRSGPTAALAARVRIKERGKDWRSYSTDATWVTQLRPLPLWNTGIYNDRGWPRAKSFGRLGDTAPWDREEGVTSEERHLSQRFQVQDQFEVQRILDNDQTGPLIAMTFNEFGHIVASRGNGPLLLIYDSDKNNIHDRVRVYCDKVKNCQGVLALNGEIFVTADGPDGPALYRLADKDRDGKLEDITTVLKFRGDTMGEHSAHGLTLGPDGLIYVILGNHTGAVEDYEEDSPHRNYYEGDLVGPRYEDPGGHAMGVKAPGGVVIRTDVQGRAVQLVAGGLRNAYDLAFNNEGELFTFDSDMESDIGAPWYRPTNIFQIVSGGEYGWRSGWAKWPEYFVDGLPAIGDAGRGSPTGVCVYDHVTFPARFHGAMFLADWSEGRILTARLKRNGASYSADTEVFLKGSPLNVTDLEVGPDGALYFVTGGRGTGGGVYRVAWKGRVPPELKNIGSGISAVIRQPQINSAFGRQKIATLKRELGERWESLLEAVARSTSNTPEYRQRALDVMQLFGPPPSEDLLNDLAAANSETVRAKAAELMGVHSSENTRDSLIGLLADSDRRVRRKACEALVRSGHTPPVKDVLEILSSDDRFEAWSARRLLERIPPDQWRAEVLQTKNHRLLVQGGLALVIADPSKENARDVIDKTVEAMDGFVTDRDFIDMLRVLQVALHRAEMDPKDLVDLRAVVAEEFPAGDPLMNRELVRLLTYAQAGSIMDRYLDHLESKTPLMEKLHLAMHLRFLKSDWTSAQKVRLIEFFEKAQGEKVGSSYPLYLMNVSRDFAKSFSGEEASLVISNGHRWPNAALGALYRLPKSLDNDTVRELSELDQRIAEKSANVFKRLQVGVVAVLARSGDPSSLAYLRKAWLRDPERRQSIAMGLAQHPDGENWSYLVRSLAIMDGPAAREVLVKLLDVEKAPSEVEYHRQVILCGLRLGKAGAEDAVKLLEYWTGESFQTEEQTWEVGIKASQKWFADNHPERPAAVLPKESQNAKWNFKELLEYLEGEDAAKGSPQRGDVVFAKANCIKCHRFGDRGESLGPDLTSISRRFTRMEVLQSIVFPSHVISDQYASKKVATVTGKTYSGILAPGGEGKKIVLQANGEKVILDDDEIEEILPDKTSSMPTGALDKLTLQEISDLFAYLSKPPTASVARQLDDE